MTTQTVKVGLICHAQSGSLIAIGGYNRVGGYVDLVEILCKGQRHNQWKRCASFPVPLGNPGVEYFRDSVFAVGRVSYWIPSKPAIYMSI